MSKLISRALLAVAIAIFSMFFGAGNAAFPLLLGQAAGAEYGWAFAGLLLTGIGGPILGLVGATLYRGKCAAFFRRAGPVGGGILMILTYTLLGPLAVLPRCATVAYSAMDGILPSLPLWAFAGFFCGIALLCCWRPSFILPALGYVLSPLLILCLLFIVGNGLFSDFPLVSSGLSGWGAFKSGLSTGYDTMDLIAAIYFSAGIWAMIELRHGAAPKVVMKETLKAGILGLGLLAIFYLGLMHAAARLGPLLSEGPPEEIMTRLANLSLGPVGGAIANVTIALACLTTVISLTMTLSRIASKEILPKRISYRGAVMLNLVITALAANLGFALIMRIIHPALLVGYPAIIVLTIVNIAYRSHPVDGGDGEEREAAGHRASRSVG